MDGVSQPSNKKHFKVRKKKTQGNPKAFSFKSNRRAARAQVRALDVATKSHHIPVENFVGEADPPIVVAVFGPPCSGKSTLISSLVKRFNKQKISNIQGPITIVASRSVRLTLIECKNDINCMIDLAKVANLVLLVFDASYGFEVETFEFLSILHVHGFPKIIGVVTHLDLLKVDKSLSQLKKRLKKNLWKEAYPGAKMIYLSQFRNNLYSKHEMLNLSRFLTTSKNPPQSWRTSHSYIIADRIEDITDPQTVHESPDCNRDLAFYGYVHGTFMRHTHKVQILGLGDFSIKNMNFLPDPCELPLRKKRPLEEHERAVYAPFSGVGSVIYDNDAVYVNLQSSQPPKNNPVEITESNVFFSKIHNVQATIDQKLSNFPIKMFAEGPELLEANFTGKNISDNDILNDPPTISLEVEKFTSTNPKTAQTSASHISLQRLIYGFNSNDQPTDCHLKIELLTKKDAATTLDDNTMYSGSLRQWKNPSNYELLCSHFTENDELSDQSSDDSDKSTSLNKKPFLKKSKVEISKLISQDESYLCEMKRRATENVKTTMEDISKMSEEEKINFQGFKPGIYVRIEITQISSTFYKNFDPSFPLIIGSVLPGEDKFGFIKLRVKCTRFYNKILKTRDPVIFSYGWHRFQTVPIYAIEDDNKRLRAIKYTPQSLHCIAVCYGPLIKPGCGVIGLQQLTRDEHHPFRPALAGVTLESDKHFEIVKKLKLIGYPFKIVKNTAFIEKMFTSPLEVAKFEGAIIKTVSGIRGHVKKASTDKPGSFRATFEDKILLSDIVFLRTWSPVKCPDLFNPVNNLLMSLNKRSSWSGMRTVAQLRADLNLSHSERADSIYRPIERTPIEFSRPPLPEKLLKSLPFKFKPKTVNKTKNPITKVELPPQRTDIEARSLLNELSIIQKDASKKRLTKRKIFLEKRKLEKQKLEEITKKRQKANQKRIYKKLAINRQHN